MFGKRKRILEISLYLLPALIFIGFVFIFPLIKIFQYSFSRIKGAELTNVGLRNYEIMFGEKLFFDAIKHNLTLLILVPVILILSLLFAILLYERMKGWKFYRFVLFVPYILAIPVIGVIFRQFFRLNGILNYILEKIGLESMAQDWIGSPSTAIGSLMIVIIWKEMGFGIILILARLMNVNKDLYEAADIDGANWIRKHIYITIPQTTTVLSFYTIILIITMISWVFNYVYIITMGGPGTATIVLEYYIYKQAFNWNNMGMASAAAVILFLFTLVFIIIYTKVRSGEELE